MTTEELLNIALPKWPAMVVRGDRVTAQQAGEIIVRTDSWWISCNDHKWSRTVLKLAGLKFGGAQSWPTVDWKDLQRFRQELGILRLDYLRNSRIASSWIGGAHGWCSWNGHIGSGNYNIGKWPTVREVWDEWGIIAGAFPYLKLTAQLWSGETCEEDIGPLVEYRVTNGAVTLHKPDDSKSGRPEELDEDVVMEHLSGFDCGSERGCTEEQLQQALLLIKAARGFVADQIR